MPAGLVQPVAGPFGRGAKAAEDLGLRGDQKTGGQIELNPVEPADRDASLAPDLERLDRGDFGPEEAVRLFLAELLPESDGETALVEDDVAAHALRGEDQV